MRALRILLVIVAVVCFGVALSYPVRYYLAQKSNDTEMEQLAEMRSRARQDETEPVEESGTGAGSEATVESGTAPEPVEESGTGTAPEPVEESGTGTGSEATVETGTAPEPAAASGTGTGAGSEATVESGTAPEPVEESGTGAGSEATVESGTAPEPAAASGTGTGSEATVETGTAPEPGEESGTGAGSEATVESGTAPEPAAASGTGAGSEATVETGTAPEPGAASGTTTGDGAVIEAGAAPEPGAAGDGASSGQIATAEQMQTPEPAPEFDTEATTEQVVAVGQMATPEPAITPEPTLPPNYWDLGIYMDPTDRPVLLSLSPIEPTPTPEPTPVPTATPVPTPTPDRSLRKGPLPYPLKEKVVLDEAAILPELREIYALNHDLVGWLTIPDTVIDYPVMQNEDSEYYLTRDFNEEENINGQIILDAQCDPYTPSYNLILSGHHMKNGSMFGSLPEYRNKRYWEKHPFVEFDTLMARKQYVIFAAFYSADYDEDEKGFRYNADIAYKIDAQRWLAEIQENQLYETGVEVEFGDEFITLTTCDRSRHRNGRFVVVCRKIREGETFE